MYTVFGTFSLLGTSRHSGLILNIFCSCFRVSHFSDEPWFLLKNGFRKCYGSGVDSKGSLIISVVVVGGGTFKRWGLVGSL
jgi:hypothetical protein